MSPNTRAPVSDGAGELLRIALENDRHHALATNTCLRIALEYSLRLAAACREQSNAEIQSLLRVEVLPTNLMGLAFRIASAVRCEVDELLNGRSEPPGPLVTDFDRHVYQALIEMLADFAWPERAAADFDGPSLTVVRRRLRAIEPPAVVLSLLTNYVANILQDGFAAARIRESVRDLPDDTEERLRSEDAASIAEVVMREVASSNTTLVPRTIDAFGSALEAFSHRPDVD